MLFALSMAFFMACEAELVLHPGEIADQERERRAESA